MQQYHDLMGRIIRDGVVKENRTGTNTLSVFGHQMRFDLQKGFPLLTTKKVSFKNIKAELIWFLRGNQNVAWLHEQGCHIWDEWARPDGTFGPIYGAQWRSWPYVSVAPGSLGPDDVVGSGYLGHDDGRQLTFYEDTIDQLADVIERIKKNPDDRRLIVSAWNVAEIPKMALPPCHVMFQFYVARGKLSCQLYQRSADVFLGVPYNIASYALLTHLVAHVCGLEVGEFIWTGGDCHLYANHLEQAIEQLARKEFPLPRLAISPDLKDIDEVVMTDLNIEDYQHHPALYGEVAI